VYPWRPGLGHGNIIWAERSRGDAYYRVSQFGGRNGKFPLTHPVAPGSPVFNLTRDTSEAGDGPMLDAFRARGYWASCFPEGDGITWKPRDGEERSDEQSLADIRACFGEQCRWSYGT
jgi:hypothetical protein